MKDKVYIRDFLSIIFKYRLMMAIILAVSVGFFFELSSLMKKKYSTDFTINVYSKYFKNPLISQIVPGMYSIQEMKQTVESMVKEAISDELIDELGHKYGIYKDAETEYELTKQRMFFRDNIRMYSDSGQSYKVSFSNSDPMVTYKVTKEILDRVTSHFINSRIETIEYVRSIMVKKLQSLNVTQKMAKTEISDNALASKNPVVLRSELNKINNDMSALRKQFNTSHPKIQNLIQRRNTILSWLKEFKTRTSTREESSEDAILMSNNKEVALNISSKLYEKYYDTNMALDLEKKSVSKYIGVIHAPQLPVFPTWPKKRLFASIGLIVGFMICFVYVFIKEVMVPPVEVTLQEVSAKLGTEDLGVFEYLPLSEFKMATNYSKHKDITSTSTSKQKENIFK
ncbi:hypothetical protein [Halobacteriovorax sp.]|uniref:hypothetical protein n=1 Tax=Halobacteriovorax sp. TaxID=2020862 RepID=UPI0035621545